MTHDDRPTGETPAPLPGRIAARSWVVLALIAGVFLALRGPVLMRQIPAQDEDYFAVPGYTILRDGLPRIPYMPTRDPAAAFYRADEVLYLLPPLYFYWQAVVYAALGSGTAQARLASALAGLASGVMVYLLGRQWLRSETAALWACGLYTASRVVYFPCVIARPDMLCCLCGLAAVWCLGRRLESGRTRWTVASGLAIGLGFLTHPFALVFALTCGLVLVGSLTTWRDRLGQGAILVAATLAAFSLWLPLIAIDPGLFARQFGNNVLRSTGPGLLSRLVWPVAAWRAQMPLMWEHVGPPQVLVLVSAGLATTWLAVRRRERRLGPPLAIAWLGVYLHVACQGSHPTKGYWVYTAAPFFVLLGGFVAEVLKRRRGSPWRRHALTVVWSLAMAAVFLPGSGLQTLVAHVRHWDDPNYDAPRFTREMLAGLPAEGRFVVDPGYAFDAYRTGRETLLGLNFPFFYDVSGESYDILIAGPTSTRDGVPAALEGARVRTLGDPADPFACHATIYTAPPHRRPAERRASRE